MAASPLLRRCDAAVTSRAALARAPASLSQGPAPPVASVASVNLLSAKPAPKNAEYGFTSRLRANPSIVQLFDLTVEKFRVEKQIHGLEETKKRHFQFCLEIFLA